MLDENTSTELPTENSPQAGMTRALFRQHGKPVAVTIEGVPFHAQVNEFSTGSFGWDLSGKTTLMVEGKLVQAQIRMNLTVVGSKELPATGPGLLGSAPPQSVVGCKMPAASADIHEFKRALVTATYQGIDEDIRRIFFDLDLTTRQQVFLDYEKAYGKRAREYAEGVYESWRSGLVKMSGDVSERLLMLLPRFLDFDQKYHLVAKLWAGYRPHTRLRLDISSQLGLTGMVEAITAAVQQAQECVPAAVLARLDWLADHDATAARALLNDVIAREAEIISNLVLEKARCLFDMASGAPNGHVKSTHVVDLPGATLEISMSDNSENRGQLVPAETPRQLMATTPIQNPNELLTEAIRNLSPEKVEQLRGVAADEALRLQVMEKEGEIDKAVIQGKLEPLVDTLRKISSNPHGAMRAETEHKSKHGHTMVTIETHRPPNAVESKRPCFVATACYGDYDHPTVLVLRRFRDQTLTRTAAGRSFVRLYYQRGPALARGIERMSVLKPPIRFALSLFAAMYSSQASTAMGRPSDSAGST